jgi:hypothetical protein
MYEVEWSRARSRGKIDACAFSHVQHHSLRRSAEFQVSSEACRKRADDFGHLSSSLLANADKKCGRSAPIRLVCRSNRVGLWKHRRAHGLDTTGPPLKFHERFVPGEFFSGSGRDAPATVRPQARRVLRLYIWLAGAGGLEPLDGGIKIRCLTAWRRPNTARPMGPAESGRTIVRALAHRIGREASIVARPRCASTRDFSLTMRDRRSRRRRERRHARFSPGGRSRL